MDNRLKRQAAMIEVRKLMETKTRGDELLSTEIEKASGLPYRELAGMIRTEMKRRGWAWEAIPNKGWRILPASGHVQYAIGRQRRAFRQEKEGLRSLLCTPTEDLTDDEKRRHEIVLAKTSTRVQVMNEHRTDVRKLLGSGERNPRLKG